MTSTQRTRFAAAAAVLVTAISLSACGTPPEPPPAAPPPPPPAAPPPPPPVSLSSGVVEAASAYEAYMARAGAISADFQSGVSVSQSLRAGESYEPQQLMRGAIAYGAVAALQDANFVANVRAFAADAGTRAQVTAAILKDPAYVVAIKGSDGAAGLVTAALSDQGGRVLDAGTAVKQAAYQVQHQAWSLGTVPNRDQRLAEAKSLSMTALLPPSEGVARLQQASIGMSPMPLTGAPKPPPYTPLVIRSLAVAALAALGQAGEENASLVAPLLSEPNTGYCLNMSKLNLYQCLAVAKPYYEDVFCLGQHVLMDTGQCVVTAAGGPKPVMIARATPVAPPPSPVSDKAPTRPKASKNKS